MFLFPAVQYSKIICIFCKIQKRVTSLRFKKIKLTSGNDFIVDQFELGGQKESKYCADLCLNPYPPEDAFMGLSKLI